MTQPVIREVWKNDRIRFILIQGLEVTIPNDSIECTVQSLLVEGLTESVEEDKVRTLQDTEREVITSALERNKGRRKQTAHELGISERTLYRKIKEYGLEYRNNRK